ncbi:MAG: bifunctional 4-hydroxy-2-oxoglutarate aldolase/2-dehydro-3-deoxy-phosphogluconate aldolase [Planctomycetota bacterium]
MKDALKIVTDSGVVAIIRTNCKEGLIETVHAISEGGIKAIEITTNTPDALNVIADLSTIYDRDFAIGAGTVLDAKAAEAAIKHGAEFLVTPNFDRTAITLAKKHGIMICSGALTPTEIINAYEAGSQIVKVFPSGSLGPGYIKALKGPLSHIPLMAVGGVNTGNVTEFFKCGASAVGVGGGLIKNDLIANGNFGAITDLVARFVKVVKQARNI